MDIITAEARTYETISLKYDPLYPAILEYIEIVKAFIARTGCVIYGGTAIDYALRLRGEQIYDDATLVLPDLDFYSSSHVTHAYDLADLLYAAGAAEARAIVAQHSETMRVDAGGYHWVADISYCPPNVLAAIPTVVYMGMKCVHPDYQRADLHASLSFPYDNSPTEVIFARWSKDVSRLNKLATAYPPVLSVIPREGYIAHDAYKRIRDKPLAGWAAFACLCAGVTGKRDYPREIVTNLSHISFEIFKSNYLFTSPEHMHHVEYYSDVIEKPTRAAYGGILPESTVVDGIVLLSSADRLISTVRVPIGDDEVLCACAQSVLGYMIAEMTLNPSSPARAAYATLWGLIVARPDLAFLQLSADVYGSTNISSSQKIAIARARGEQIEGLPTGYTPAKGKRPQTFMYDGDMWIYDGRMLA